jgi:hypothetical protein
MALDPSGTPTNDDPGEAFEDGVLVFASGTATIKPFGHLGHQTPGFRMEQQSAAVAHSRSG